MPATTDTSGPERTLFDIGLDEIEFQLELNPSSIKSNFDDILVKPFGGVEPNIYHHVLYFRGLKIAFEVDGVEVRLGKPGDKTIEMAWRWTLMNLSGIDRSFDDRPTYRPTDRQECSYLANVILKALRAFDNSTTHTKYREVTAELHPSLREHIYGELN